MKSEHGISRLDQAATGTRGWQVRLQRNSVRFVRFFADERWGGVDSALERARQFRDRVLQRLARQGVTRVRSHTTPASRNRSGVVGVTRVVSLGANGVDYAFWEASWSPGDGQRCRVRFSVLRHGDQEAFRLACAARENALNRGGDEE